MPSDMPSLEPTEAKEKPRNGEITIHKDSEFFIAVATDSHLHSFVLLGVMQNQKPILLARIGKSNLIDPDADSCCKITAKEIFSCTKAQLQSEPLTLRKKISYAAYNITYPQYLKFINLVKSSPSVSTDGINCFLPDDSKEERDTMVLKKRNVIKKKNGLSTQYSPQEKNILDRSCQLNASNTCRDTAVDLIEYTHNIDHLSNHVSRTFFRDLPLKTYFTNEIPRDHFYVFPIPPNAYHLDKKQTAILTTIYKRMETLLQKDPYSKETIAKFNALKTLYLSQAGSLQHDDLNTALTNIRDWKKANQAVIQTLRAQSSFGKLFTRQSSTVTMANNLERDLAQAIKTSKLH